MKKNRRDFALMTFVFLLPLFSTAQSNGSRVTDSVKKAPNDWFEQDRATSGYYGISLDKAYDFLKGKKSTPVVVAVIDSGVDTLQQDLKPILWRNPGEIPGNGIDDDHNGYVDDVYGWNFIGGKDGRNVHQDSYEAARVYWKLKPKYDSISDAEIAKLNADQKQDYANFLRAKKDVTTGIDPAELLQLQRVMPILEQGDSIIAKDLGKTEYTGKDLQAYNATDPKAKMATMLYLNISKANNSYDISNQDILNSFRGQVRKGESATTPPENFRDEIVKDDPDDINDRFYGNNDVMAGTPSHGTHCSGIIAAVRNNGIGMNGVADNVKIMMVRAVPDGDEHDKDIANAIRYAVDNGAKVISMSFGKGFSPQKKWVDDAVKYAQSKDVLLVHAAGNDANDIDSVPSFPTPVYLDQSGKAQNYITVGASGDATNGGFTANFSNYGKKSVDVFSPGVNIYSTLPDNKYGNYSGTSMATPVVAGIAALIREYYPNLSAVQVKYAIEKSVVPEKDKVILPGTQKAVNRDGEEEWVNLSDISVYGGEVNAFTALKLASTLKAEPMKEPKLPKSKVKRNRRG